MLTGILYFARGSFGLFRRLVGAGDDTTAETFIVVVEDDRLARSDGALGLIEADPATDLVVFQYRAGLEWLTVARPCPTAKRGYVRRRASYPVQLNGRQFRA